VTDGERAIKAQLKAKDDFFESNPKILDGPASGVYLKNRLLLALAHGWSAAERHFEKKEGVTHG
jgi:hypothetical protein